MSTVGFPVGIQEVLPSGGEILHTNFFSINSGTSDNIKKDESIYIFATVYIMIYVLMRGRVSFLRCAEFFKDSLVNFSDILFLTNVHSQESLYLLIMLVFSW